MDEYCDTQTYPQTMESPAEYCENEAVPGTGHCEKHQPHNMEPDPDAARDARNEGL